MEKKYYVNNRAQLNGDHEVHEESCIYLPTVLSKRYSGEFYSCKAAVAEAKKSYNTADGCKTCSSDCHTQ